MLYYKKTSSFNFEVIIISYTDKARNCVACGDLFKEEDDVVFCPVCGAPHHRSCWMEEGHCHYEIAHGTDLQWHPKEEPEEPKVEEPSAPFEKEDTHSPFGFSGGVVVTKCPHCGRIVPCEEHPTLCRHCGEEIPGVATPFQRNESPFGNQEATAPDEPIDTANVGKLSRIVMQRREYYIPRFQALKSQGKKTVSWNWSAFFLTTYWFAYRKCYLWAVVSSLIELVALLLVSPMSSQITTFLASQQITSYSQAAQLLLANMEFTQSVMYLAYGALAVLLIRSVIFGLFGNLIYKKDCLRRAQQLDEMPKEEAAYRVFKLSGISIFAPILFYYLTGILETVVTSFV